jgi:hypothetical protein
MGRQELKLEEQTQEKRKLNVGKEEAQFTKQDELEQINLRKRRERRKKARMKH